MNKYVVICIAGQSNAVGYDESPVTYPDYTCRNKKRIKQLGFYGDDNLNLVELDYCAQSLQNLKMHNRAGFDTPGTKGIHLPLANLLLDLIPEDYGILLLPIAYGGTAFTAGDSGTYDSSLKKPCEEGVGGGTVLLRWGKDTAYYYTLRDRIIHSLSLNNENIFGGLIWCQGESDSEDAAGHFKAFSEMTEALFLELNDAGLGSRVPKGIWDKDIWYPMETVSYWYTMEGCVKIWNNYKNWNPDNYIAIPRETDSNEVNGTGQTASIRGAHFGNNAYATVIAPRVLDKLLERNAIPVK